MLLHDGQANIVPFSDGSMPNAPPHNLPSLTSAATIANLNPGQLDACCDGYVGVGHGLWEQQGRLLLHGRSGVQLFLSLREALNT
ncbi:hypothetical protein AX14_011666 [Amanita brunnescens Koide BX004]|nr:hypothetical protein AX14_011666 [Amanita brunnescens Koide BX004]